jgi:hypothetical protein
MPGSNISTDALRLQLMLDLVGGQKTIDEIKRIGATADIVNAKTKKQQEELSFRRMEVEGRFDPEAQRNFEIEKAIKLTNELNLNLKTQDAILSDIEDKFQKAISPAVMKEGPQQDAHVQSFLAAQAKADRDFVAAKQRVAKEIEDIEQESLTRSQRYVIQLAKLREDRDKGLSSPEGFMVRARALKAQYDTETKAEQDALKVKQDAADKRAKIDSDRVAKAAAAARAAQLAANVEFKAQADAYNADNRAASRRLTKAIMARDTAEQTANNRARQEAVNLMNSYQTSAQRATADIARFNAMLAAGTLTADEHAQAIANVETRQRMMAGGAGHLGYMVGNVATGMEDFVTVLSITGFGMEGFSAATRSASNNIGQAVRSLGTATSAMFAPVISIGVVLLGFAIPAVYRWITGAEDAAKSTAKFADELERLAKAASVASRIELADLELKFKIEDVGDIKTSDALDAKVKEAERAIDTIKAKMKVLDDEMKGKSVGSFDKMVGTKIEQNFQNLGAAFEQVLGGDVGTEIRTNIKERFDDIKQKFIDESRDIGGEEARANLENRMRVLANEMELQFDDLSVLQRKKMADLLMTTGSNPTTALFDFAWRDSDLTNQIQAMQGELDKLNESEREQHVERKRELEDQIALLKELQDQRQAVVELEAEARAEAMHLDRQAMDNELEMMEIQSKRNSLLGEENEAERQILDLALRRREIMESGVAAPGILEGMFNSELQAMANDIEFKLNKATEVTAQTGVAGQAEAYAKANEMLLAASSKESKTEEKEMIELLKAIKDHLAGKNLLNVEIQ